MRFRSRADAAPLTGYAYVTPFDLVQHFAFVQGEIGDGRDMPARLHRVDIIADVIAGGDSIRKTLRAVQEGRPRRLRLSARRHGRRAAQRRRRRPADSEAQRTKEWREIGLGAQILHDLGISSIRLRTSAPFKYVGLSGFGIEIAACEPLE